MKENIDDGGDMHISCSMVPLGGIENLIKIISLQNKNVSENWMRCRI